MEQTRFNKLLIKEPLKYDDIEDFVCDVYTTFDMLSSEQQDGDEGAHLTVGQEVALYQNAVDYYEGPYANEIKLAFKQADPYTVNFSFETMLEKAIA